MQTFSNLLPCAYLILSGEHILDTAPYPTPLSVTWRSKEKKITLAVIKRPTIHDKVRSAWFNIRKSVHQSFIDSKQFPPCLNFHDSSVARSAQSSWVSAKVCVCSVEQHFIHPNIRFNKSSLESTLYLLIQKRAAASPTSSWCKTEKSL